MEGRCVHCGESKINRPRKLCYRCFGNEEIRCLYPKSESKYARQGEPDYYGGYRKPPCQTYARPGTEEKIKVMRERADNKCTIWHPQDWPGDWRTETAWPIVQLLFDRQDTSEVSDD